MSKYQQIDDLIQEGYKYVLRHEYTNGCDKWLEAWDLIKELFIRGEAKDVIDLDKKYNFTQSIFNYTSDLEMELHNAGLEDKSYHLKRANYCQELLRWCGEENSNRCNTRRGMADAYFELGDTATGEKLYQEMLEEDPDWGFGYIGWSGSYYFGPQEEKRYEKAEEILLRGYAREGLRDKLELVDNLVGLYEDMGKPEKVEEFKTIQSKLRKDNRVRLAPKPVKAVKIGRNEPCPCGSGKKYKKCCLS